MSARRYHRLLPAIIALLLLATGQLRAADAPANFINGQLWYDTTGQPISAHGGGVVFHEGLYYWYGEARTPALNGARWGGNDGVRCYSSPDLKNWKDEGVVFKVSDDPQSDVARGCVLERPKVIYNEKTKTWVCWFHLELKGSRYGSARAALATSASPTGPFNYIKSLRPSAGHWPVNYPKELQQPLTGAQTNELMKEDRRKSLREGAYLRRDFAGGQMSRDMSLFVDDDQKAYLITSSEENFTLHLHELTDDYQGFTGKYARIAPGQQSEAPAILKRDGTYYLLASGCTGWTPNPARLFKTKDLFGDWDSRGNPCRGMTTTNLGPDQTFGGQSASIFQVQGKPGLAIAIFDVWRPPNIYESGYIWLPVVFEDNLFTIPWQAKFEPPATEMAQ